MSWRAVPARLRARIRSNLVFMWDTNEGHDTYEEELMLLLPPVLRQELCYHIYGGVIRSVPFLAWLSDYGEVVKQLTFLMESKFLELGDHIFRTGEFNTEIYILLTGRLRISRNEKIDLVDETVDQFFIPRKKEQSLMQLGVGVFKPVVKSAKVKLKNAAREQTAGKGKSWMKQTKHEHDEPEMEVPSSPSAVKLASPPPPSTAHGMGKFLMGGMYHQVKLEQKKEDLRQKIAAKFVQRLWRAKKIWRGPSPLRRLFTRHIEGGLKLNVNEMPTCSVNAPAFLGEACLWSDPAEWEIHAPGLYTYSAWCEERSEIVVLRRQAIQQVLNRFGWLEDRFKFFREKVLDSIDAKYKGAKDLEHTDLYNQPGMAGCDTTGLDPRDPKFEGVARDDSPSETPMQEWSSAPVADIVGVSVSASQTKTQPLRL